MKLKDVGEFGFINRISRGCVVRPENVVKAIGDDAAAFSTDAGQLTLVTTDLLLERVHFLREETSGFDLGNKALAVNLSDIAAMGGTAREAFVSLAIPEDCSLKYLEHIYEGMNALAAMFQVNILGGDTTKSLSDLVINIAVAGQVSKEQMLCRDAAKPGDTIYLTGPVGDSRAGLHLILKKISHHSDALKSLVNAHVRPMPHLAEGRFLAAYSEIHAGIDISDGLSSDIGHIASQSKTGVRLYADKIPVSENLKFFCKEFGFDPFEYALAGGEDYVLAVTASDSKTLEYAYQKKFDRPLYAIGEITDSGVMELVLPDKTVKTLQTSGWDHFKK